MTSGRARSDSCEEVGHVSDALRQLCAGPTPQQRFLMSSEPRWSLPLTISTLMSYQWHHPDGEYLRNLFTPQTDLVWSLFFYFWTSTLSAGFLFFPLTLRLMGFECKCEGGVEGQTIYSVLISLSRRGSLKGPACNAEHHLMVGRQTVGDGDLNAHL